MAARSGLRHNHHEKRWKLSILNIVEAIQVVRGKRDRDTVQEQSPKGENSYNGAAAQSKKEVEGIFRAPMSSTEERIGEPLVGQAVFGQLLVAHVTTILTRMVGAGARVTRETEGRNLRIASCGSLAKTY